MDSDMVDVTGDVPVDPLVSAPNVQSTIDPAKLLMKESEQATDMDNRDPAPSAGLNGTAAEAVDASDAKTMDSAALQPNINHSPVRGAPSKLSIACLPSGVCYDARMKLHATLVDGDDHPESPRRITAIYNALVGAGLISEDSTPKPDETRVLQRIEAREATAEEICSVHSHAHLKSVRQTQAETFEMLCRLSHTGDSIYYNNSTYSSARLAVGGCIESCKAVLSGSMKNAFAVVRPPGHHAVPAEAQGFCIFNNVSVAARVCRERFRDQCRKILIFDWDVHHGNGTQDTFYQDPNVLYISIHVHENGKFYPGSESGNQNYVGEDIGVGKNVNVPWTQRGMGDADYMYAFRNVVLPIAAEFDPDLILVSAGFDAAEGDEIGQCHVTPACYAHMTHALMALARGKLVVCLEGGYNLQSISNCALEVARTLMGEPPERLTLTAPSKLAIEDVHKVMRRHAPYWVCLSAYGPSRDFSDVSGQRMHDVIRIYQSRLLRELIGAVSLAVLRPTLFRPFKDQVIATPQLHNCRVLLCIVHDPPEIFGVPDPETRRLDSHQTWLADPLHDYIYLANKHGFGVVDVNIPKHVTNTDGSTATDDDPRPAIVKASQALALHLWDSYIQPSEASSVFLMGVGEAHHAILHILNSRFAECSTRVHGVVNMVSDVDLHSLHRDSEQLYQSWYYKCSKNYVNDHHDIWAPDRKISKRRYGNTLRSPHNSAVKMLISHREEVLTWMFHRAQMQNTSA